MNTMATDNHLHSLNFKVFLLIIVVLVNALSMIAGSTQSENINQCSTNSTVLYLLVLGPFPDPQADPGPGWDAAPAFIPAARLAVKQINNRSDILAGYQLELLEGDSGCNLEDRAFLSFVNKTFYPCRGKTLVGIIGPGCSAATLALAPLTVLEEFNILQMSIATTPLINGTIREHRNTFRTVTSSLKFIDAFEEIITQQKWNRVAALYDNLRVIHIATHNEFRNRIRNLRVKTFYSSGIEEQILPGALSDLIRLRIRVIFIFAGRNTARQVLCAAFHRGMMFPSYQFFFTDRILDDFIVNVSSFQLGQEEVACSSQQMSKVLNGVILSINQFKRQDQTTNNTAAGLSYAEHERFYYKELDEYLQEINLTRSDFAATAFNYFNAYYDATWALALSLNNSVEELASRGYNLSYHYRYNRPSTKEVGDIVRSKLIDLKFEGMSGTIIFDEDRHDVSSIGIDLNQSSFDVDSGNVTQYKAGVFEQALSISDRTQLIPDAFKTVIVQIPLGVSIFFIAVMVIVTIGTVFLQIAFVYYANHKSVKASSPDLNHLIFSGCYLCLLAIVVFISQEVFAHKLATNLVLYGVSCSMSFWTTSISFSLIFGTVVGKTWRIYRIFTHFSQDRVKFVSNEYLIAFVVVLILIDTVVLCLWNSINPWYLLERFEISDSQELLTRYVCWCDNLIVWAAVILGLKGMVAVIAVYLSILTNKVHREEYKMTKNISVFIYSLIVIYGLGIIIVIFTNVRIPILSFVAMNIMFISTVVMTCACLIVPPLLPIKNFWGSKILAKSSKLKRELTFSLNRSTDDNTSALRNRKHSYTKQYSLSPLITSPTPSHQH